LANDTTELDLPQLRKHGMTLLFAMRNSWLDMAAFLKMVEQKELWKKWDFKSFTAFYEQEYELTLAEVKVLKLGADTVSRVAPEVLALPPEKREVPSLKVVQAFAKGEKLIGAEAMAEVGKSVFTQDKSAAQKLAMIEKVVDATPKQTKEEKPKAAGQDEKRVAELAKKLCVEMEKLQGVSKALREHAAALVSGLDDLAAKQSTAAA
jgi:hypothetical protein